MKRKPKIRVGWTMTTTGEEDVERSELSAVCQAIKKIAGMSIESIDGYRVDAFCESCGLPRAEITKAAHWTEWADGVVMCPKCTDFPSGKIAMPCPNKRHPVPQVPVALSDHDPVADQRAGGWEMSATRERCKAEVCCDTRWPKWTQCSRYAWKDGFCKQHHPDSVSARNEAARKRNEEKHKSSPWYLLSLRNEEIAELKAEITRLRTELEAGK